MPSENKKIKEQLPITDNTDFWYSTPSIDATMTVTGVKNIIESGLTIDRQDLIDKFITLDDFLLSKYKDCRSAVRKAVVSYDVSMLDNPDQVLDDLKTYISPVLTNEILKHFMDASFRGFALAEIFWEIKGNKAIPASLKPIQPRSIEFDDNSTTPQLYDSDANVLTPIPPDKTIQVLSPIVFENKVLSLVEGLSLLLLVKYYAQLKDFPRFMEVCSVPARIGTLEAGASKEDVSILKTALKSVGSDMAAVITGLSKIEFMQPKSNDPKVFTEAIKIVNEAIARVTVGQTGTSEGGSKASQASLRVLNGVREDTLADYLDDISTAINRDLIEPFCRFNYNLKAIPKFQLLVPAANTDKIEQDVKLKGLGVQFKKSYIARRYDIDEDDFEMVESTPVTSFNSEMLKKKAKFS